MIGKLQFFLNVRQSNMFLASRSPPAEDTQLLLQSLSPGRQCLGCALGSKGVKCIQHDEIRMLVYIVLT